MKTPSKPRMDGSSYNTACLHYGLRALQIRLKRYSAAQTLPTKENQLQIRLLSVPSHPSLEYRKSQRTAHQQGRTGLLSELADKPAFEPSKRCATRTVAPSIPTGSHSHPPTRSMPFPAAGSPQKKAAGLGTSFFDWYNYQPIPFRLNLLTPTSVHYGQADAIRQQRQAVLAAAYCQLSQAFGRGIPLGKRECLMR